MNNTLARWRVVVLACWAIFGMSFHATWAADMPRVILGLYDSTEDYNRQEDNNLIHNNAEMVLNYLGMKVRFHDMSTGLPQPEDLQDVQGILSWFRDEQIAHASEYCRWAIRQIQTGKKFVILKNIGGFKDRQTKMDTDFDLVQQFYAALGLEYRAEWTDNPMLVELKAKDPSMVEFERTLQDEIGDYENIKPVDPQSHVYLTLNRKDIPDGESAVVVTTPFGGLAVEDYGFYLNYFDDSRRWRLDPFRFFEEAFGVKGTPRMDTTTLLGRRIFYSHIDGDGFRNISEIDPQKYSSEVVRDEILKKYDLPITVSVIQAEIDPDYFGTKRNLKIAQEIFRLPNVEAGSHAFSHPLDWDKRLTSFVISGYSHRIDIEAVDLDLKDNAYFDAARVTVSEQEFLKREISDAVDYLNKNVVPQGKEVKVYQWSGNCRATAEALLWTKRLGLLTINGGDSRFDQRSPTYTSVAPLARQALGNIQPYAGSSNENIYTQGWRKDFHAFQYVLETFAQTQEPSLIKAAWRRVTPVNVYYHFYIGEKDLALKSLKKIYDDVLTQNLIPLFTSEYLKIVEGFHSAKIEPLPDGGWKIRDYQADRTVRFDHEARIPDLNRCQGVMGFNKVNEILYISLAEGEEAEIYLTDNPPAQPYLKESATLITDWRRVENGFEFRSRGFNDAHFIFANMKAGAQYAWQSKDESDPRRVDHGVQSVNGQGELILVFPHKGWQQVSVRQVE